MKERILNIEKQLDMLNTKFTIEHPFEKWVKKNIKVNIIDNNNYIHIQSILNTYVKEHPEYYPGNDGDLYYRLLHIMKYSYPRSFVDLDNYDENKRIYNIKCINNNIT